MKQLEIPIPYISKIQNRSSSRYAKGLIARLIKYLKYSFVRWYAIRKGASIGKNSIIPWKLAKKANKNLIVGIDSIIETDNFDLRAAIIIGDHVIINKDVTILRLSHCINGNTLFDTLYYSDLIIEDYSWIATGAKILPQVNSIEYGTVCGAFSVITRNTERMGVYGGNPAKRLKDHNTVFSDLVVCSLVGGDLMYYVKAKNSKSY